MSSATCSHPDGCTCINYNDDLMARPDMSHGGICINCNHAVNLHPRRPSGKCYSHIIPIDFHH